MSSAFESICAFESIDTIGAMRLLCATETVNRHWYNFSFVRRPKPHRIARVDSSKIALS
jgi:hypothetical protein